MEKIITNVKAYELSDEFEITTYERGHGMTFDSRHDELEDAIRRANILIQEYKYHPDDIKIKRITYFENIIDEVPF